MYADRDFYENVYFGEIIPAASFEKFISKAAEKLDYLSNDNVPGYTGTDEKIIEKIKKANCKIADLLYSIEQMEKSKNESVGYTKNEDGSMKGKIVKSISAGNESITYGEPTTQNDSLMSVLFDDMAKNRLLFNSIREYLGKTGLLSQIL